MGVHAVFTTAARSFGERTTPSFFAGSAERRGRGNEGEREMGQYRRISQAPSGASAMRAPLGGLIARTRRDRPRHRATPADCPLTDWPQGERGFHPGGWDPITGGHGGHGAKPLSGPLVSRASRLPGRGAHFFCALSSSGERRGQALAETSYCRVKDWRLCPGSPLRTGPVSDSRPASRRKAVI
jgi:hypothetical protein